MYDNSFMRRILSFLALFVSAVTFADDTVALPFGNYKRTYVVHNGSTKPSKSPLVVLLHGWTSDAKSMLYTTEFRECADENGFIVAAPNGLNGGWNAGFIDLSGKGQDDVEFIDKMIDDLQQRYSVDRDRIYIVGHSNGAMLAYAYAARHTSRCAAVVAVSGTIGVRRDTGKWVDLKPPVGKTNVLIIHGVRDPMVAYDRSTNALLQGVGAQNAAKKWATWLDIENTYKLKRLGDLGELVTYHDKQREVRLLSLKNGFHEWPGGRSGRRRESKSGFAATPYIWRWLASKTLVAQ